MYTKAIFVVFLAGQGLAQSQAGPSSKAVLIFDGQVAVVSHGAITKLTESGTDKSSPVWSPSGSTIAFLDTIKVDRLPELTILDESGHMIAHHQLFPNSIPGVDTASVVPRSLGILGYVAPDKLLVEGSVNRWACMYMFVNARTGEAGDQTLGECGRSQLLPNGHLLTEPNLRAGPPVNWRDYLSVDEKSTYPSSDSSVRFISDPAFSADGSWIGVVERDVENGKTDVAIVAPGGRATRVPLPSSFAPAALETLDESAKRPVGLIWRNGAFLISDGSSTFQVAPGDQTPRAVAPLSGPEQAALSLAVRRERAEAARRSVLRSVAGSEKYLESFYDVWPSPAPLPTE